MRFAFIAAEKARHSVTRLCRCLRVTPSGFYAWTKRGLSARAQRDLVVSEKRVARLMREAAIRGKVRRRFKNTTMSDHTDPIALNVLARDFTAAGPNQRWVGDTSEFLISEHGKLYLAAILDLYSRFVVGWAISAVNDRRLTLKALEMAVQRRCPEPGLLHHSDRGCTYTCEDYQTYLASHGITCSMSRRADCYDNAVMEAFFSTVKREEAECFPSYSDAKMAVFDYIEVFYNQRRRHSTLGKIVRPPSNDARQRRSADGGALGGQCSSATNHDGHATERPSTFSDHRRRLTQRNGDPADLTNPSTESDQAHGTTQRHKAP
jgi:putative transposase